MHCTLCPPQHTSQTALEESIILRDKNYLLLSFRFTEGLSKTKIGNVKKEHKSACILPCEQISSNDWKLIFTNWVDYTLLGHNGAFVSSDIFICSFPDLGKNYVNFPSDCLAILSHKLFRETWIQMFCSFSISFHHKFQSSELYVFSVTIQSFYSKGKKQNTAVSNQATFASSSIVKIQPFVSHGNSLK